jgi:hypothetical protein
MTQDYKDILLRYLTGNLNIETGDNTPQFEEEKEISNTLGSFISTNAGSNYNIIDVLQGLNSNYSVIYGNTNNNKGFMVIIDENYEPIQYIDSYSSGTKFGEFKILNVAEDGNLYGIDITSVPRFIMLNNVTLKTPNQSEFIVRLRQSYNLPSPLSTAINYFGITKAVGQGKYLIGYVIKSGSYNNAAATELTINVGAENDWVNYTINGTAEENFVGCSLWASWNNNDIDFRIEGYSTSYVQLEPGQPEVLRAFYRKWTPNSNNNLVGSGYILNIEGFDNGYYSINTVSVNKYLTYVGVYDGGEYGDLEKISIYSYSTRGDFNYSEEIATFQPGPTVGTATINKRIEFKVLNGNAYFIAKALDGSLNLHLYTGFMVTATKTIYEYIVEYGILYNTEILPTTQNSDDFLFYISNIYNLYNYNILGMDFNNQTGIGTSYLIQQIYNAANYNGISYENVNALVPHSGIVYDSNDLIVFARNIYNKSVYNNTTLSVIQIPNTMCNNMVLATQNLLGETNKVLTSNEENIEKNIYETLYLNFYNSLLIQNQNTEEYVTNMTGSARLNSSVSLNKDYDNAKITKYRVNYIDNTYEVHPVQGTIENGIATFIMYVYTREYVTSVELISDDEITSYQTITGIMEDDGNGFVTLGKLYKLTQECHIE